LLMQVTFCVAFVQLIIPNQEQILIYLQILTEQKRSSLVVVVVVVVSY
jgi:hypothetical protein